MRTTPAETERNNQIIMEAAIEVFAEKGYVAANMQDIAERAGISRGPLYYRHKTKLDLFKDAFAEQSSRRFRVYKRILEQEKYILDILREDLEFYTTNSWEGQAIPEILIPNLPELREVQEMIIQSSLELFDLKVEAVKRAIARGEMREDTDPRRVVNMLFVFAQGLRPAYDYYRIIQVEKEQQNVVDDMLYLIQTKYCIK